MAGTLGAPPLHSTSSAGGGAHPPRYAPADSGGFAPNTPFIQIDIQRM